MISITKDASAKVLSIYNKKEFKKEFRVLNLSIEKLSLYYGIFLIIWGIIVSFVSGSTSATSYIPSFLGFPLFVFSQSKTVTGIVNDENSSPLPGATVQLKGSESIGAITDFDGNFSIQANQNDILIIE